MSCEIPETTAVVVYGIVLILMESRAIVFLGEGNLKASSGHYQTAIDLFTDACKLDPSDFR